MRRTASIPFSVGIPMSRRIKSGFSSSAFWAASNPSDASPMICNSAFLLSCVQINRRNGSKSSTTRTRADDFSIAVLFIRCYVNAVHLMSKRRNRWWGSLPAVEKKTILALSGGSLRITILAEHRRREKNDGNSRDKSGPQTRSVPSLGRGGLRKELVAKFGLSARGCQSTRALGIEGR
jgi:hypothetical protein